MILKSLEKNHLTTITYYKDGLLKSCQGHIYQLNLNDQTLSLKDEKQNIFSIRLSGIKEIN